MFSHSLWVGKALLCGYKETPSTMQHITSALVGQEQLDLVRPMSDASDVGETDILGSDP